jgi:hypothetical protein
MKNQKIYIKKNILFFEGKNYERLYNSPTSHKYRVILSDEDYDYVENKSLINKLNIIMRKIS